MVPPIQIKEAKKWEKKTINVDEKVENVVKVIVRMGLKSHPSFENYFLSKIRALDGFKVRWKQAVDKAIDADERDNIPEVLRYKALSAQMGAEYEILLLHLAAEVLNSLGKIADMSGWFKKFRKDLERQRIVSEEAKRAIHKALAG